MKNPIVVVGSLNMDLMIQVDRHPTPGETLLGGEFHTYPGGKGANQAVAAARLGCHVELVGRVGADAFGEELLRSAATNGVGITYVKKDPHAATGVALITLNSDGQNTIVVAPGANACLCAEDISVAEPAISQAGILLAVLEPPLATIQTAIEMAHYHAVQVILNPAPAQPLSNEILAQVDFLIPNQHELAILSGTTDVESGVQHMLDHGVKTLVVTLGEDGLMLAQGKQRLQIPAHQVQVIDTVAAGDAFVAGFATALAEERSLEDACHWGNAAGAIAVSRRGAQPSLPYREEVERLCHY